MAHSNEELEEMLTDLTLKTVALTTVVTRLLAREAARDGDPEAVFRDFSQSIDFQIDWFQATKPGRIAAGERCRLAVDGIVAQARMVLPE